MDVKGREGGREERKEAVKELGWPGFKACLPKVSVPDGMALK
jgi:hypothetical protein